MLRSPLHSKRLSLSHQSSILNQTKRIKPAVKIPIAEQIHIKDKKIIFHFGPHKTHAEEFIKVFKVNLRWVDVMFLKSAKISECTHTMHHGRCAAVVLSVDQLNAWLGPKAFEDLAEIDELYRRNKLPRLVVKMQKVHVLIANMAVFLINDKAKLLHATMAYTPISTLFVNFFSLLNPEVLHKVALQQNHREWYTLKRVARYRSDKTFSFFLSKLTKDVCNQAVLIPNKITSNILVTLASRKRPIKFIEFIKMLSVETCDKIALRRDKKGVLILNAISRYQKNTAFITFIEKLSTATCNKAVLDFKSAQPILETIALYQEAEEFIYFVKRLTTNTCKKAAFLDNGSEGLIFISLANNLAIEAFQFYINKLGKDVCNQLALQLNRTNMSILVDAAEKKDNFILFLQQLTQETCDQIALMTTTANRCGLERMASANSQEIFGLFLPRVSHAACIKLGFTHDKNSHPLFYGMTDVDAPLVNLCNKIIKHPEEIKKISKADSGLTSIEFYDGGGSIDKWSRMAASVIKIAPPISKPKLYLNDLSEKIEVKLNRTRFKPTPINSYIQHKWRLLRLQGRTILLQKNPGKILAIKVAKKNESYQDLEKECQTTRYLKKHATKMGLKSSFPTPLEVIELEGILDWLASSISRESFSKFNLMVDDTNKHIVYIYKVNAEKCDYFTYLHNPNISSEDFKKANHIAVNDLFTLLQHGVVFPQLADMFHNSEECEDRPDKGRYLVLANLIRDFYDGSGRLTGWKEAIEYPNIRASGLADLGDRISLNEFIGETTRVKNFFSEAFNSYKNKASNYLFANTMAEYQYVLFLIAGRRGCELAEHANKVGKSAEEIQAIWLTLASQIVTNCVEGIAILTHQPEGEIQKSLLAIIDLERLARQMQYWMTGEYIPDVMKDKIRAGIYGSDTSVDVKRSKFRENTFNEEQGCSIDGIHADLGPVNGPEPIKEANKLLYWMVIHIFTAYNAFHLTVEDIYHVVKEPDLQKSEDLRKNSFTHLSGKSYHAIQFTLCNERLKQKKALPDTAIQALTAEANEHRRQNAAYTIAQLWRKQKQDKLTRHTAVENLSAVSQSKIKNFQ